MRWIRLAVVVSASVLFVVLSAEPRRESAEAQQPGSVPRVGVLLYGTPGE